VPKLCVTVNEVVVPSPDIFLVIRPGVSEISLVKATVPEASGSVTVLSAVRVPASKVSSLASAAEPSNMTPLDVDTVSTLFVVVVPVTCKLPGIITVGALATVPIVTFVVISPNLSVRLPF